MATITLFDGNDRVNADDDGDVIVAGSSHDTANAGGNDDTRRKTIVFIDHRVPDEQTLIAGLGADSEWVRLDADSDGLLQMQTALADRCDLASIRILAHGRPGALTIGAGELTGDGVDHRAEELARIGQALHPGGDVQIYGCAVGQGSAGRAFVRALSETLGAPVAAASTPVGHAALGGDWRLDVGRLRTPPLDHPHWRGLLGLTIMPLTPSFPGHSAGEFRNQYAFAALRADGSVVTWGESRSGGDSGGVASALDGTIDVTQVFSTQEAFAALRADGSVVTWGVPWAGGDSGWVASALDGTIDVTQVFSTESAFAALRADGSVVTWGHPGWGGESGWVAWALDGTIDVTQVFSTGYAFAALRADGSVVTWGESWGDSGRVASALDGTIDVTQVFSTESAFAALRADGSVVTWGHPWEGGDSGGVAWALDGTIDVTQVFSTETAFAALRSDGSVVTWGDSDYGGDSGGVASALDGTIDVTQVFSTRRAFAALRADGSVVTWGDSWTGGDSGGVASALDGTIDVTQVFSTRFAFAALRDDGSVVTWGDSWTGGDSSEVASALDGTIDVTQVFSTGFAFAALRADGSVVTWGASWGGGDSSEVASALDGTIDVTQVASTRNAFAALRADGSVVTWGASESGGQMMTTTANALQQVVSLANPLTNDVWISEGQSVSTVVVAALDVSQVEGDQGNTVFDFEVRRFGAIDQPCSLDFAVNGLGAASADAADFGGALPAGSVRFAPGESRQVVSISVSADRIAEQDERFTFRLANPVGAVIAIGEAHATLRNDEMTAVAVAAVDPERLEGDRATTAYTFTLTRSGILDGVSTVDYRVVGNGDAPADAIDFGGSLPAGTITFVPGESSKQITIKVSGDTRVEGDEGFALQLSYPRGTGLGVDTAVAVIRSDDTQPTVWISAEVAERSEADASVTPFTFTLHRAGDLSQAASVDYAVAGSGANAAAAADFSGGSSAGTISFAPGETARVIEVATSDDGNFESDEAFTVTLSHPNNVVIDGGMATGTILDDDDPVHVWAEALDTTKPEGDSGHTEFNFRIVRSGDRTASSTVAYRVIGDGEHPADAADFGGVLPSGVVNFALGEAERSVRIAVSGDGTIEAGETFALILDSPTNARLAGANAWATIDNDDGMPEVSIAATSPEKAEGDSNRTAYEFVATRTGDLSNASSVDFLVAGNGAHPVDVLDFGTQWPAGTVRFAPGEASKLLVVEVSGDREIEAHEEFIVSLLNPEGTTIGMGNASGLVVNDDDPATVSIWATNSYQPEGDDGQTAFTFELTRTGNLAESSTVFYHVHGEGSDAVTGDDFGGAFPAGEVTFAPGETARKIVIDVLPDAQIESHESFTISIAAVDNAIIAGSHATATLLDDDGPVEVSVTPVDAQQAEGESGSVRSFLVRRTGDASQPLNIFYRVSNNGVNSADPDDFGGAFPLGTLSFASGEFEKTLDLIISPDDEVEGSESFKVNLSWASATGTLDRSSTTATILDDSYIAVECRPLNAQPITPLLENFIGVHSYLIYKPEWGEEKVISGYDSGGQLVVVTDIPLSLTVESSFRDQVVRSNAALLNLGTRDPADVWELMTQQGENVNDWNSAYSFFGPNCHATTATIMHAVGLDFSSNRPGNFIHQAPDGGGSVLGFDYMLEGTPRDDIIRGDSGKDVLHGNEGSDEIRGGNGVDTLYGGEGSDDMYGDEDGDYLYGEEGGDSLHGGSGADHFYLRAGNGDDFIFDFETGTDVLEYVGTSRSSVNLFDYGNNGTLDTLITLTGGGSVTLIDVGSEVSIGEPQSVPEGRTTVFEVIRSGNISTALTVYYTIIGNIERQGSITFAANSALATIRVASQDNTVDEPDRQYTVTILDPGKDTVVLGNATAAGMILDNDPTPDLVLADATRVTIGVGSADALIVNDDLDEPLAVAISVPEGLTQAIFSAAVQNGQDVVSGAYGNETGNRFEANPFTAAGGLQGSNDLIDLVGFTSGVVDVPWVG